MGSGGLITHGTDRLQRSRQFLSSEPSPPNSQPENNAPLPRIPQSPGGRRRRRPDCAFDTLPSLVPCRPPALSFLRPFLLTFLALREYSLRPPISRSFSLIRSRSHSQWQNSSRSREYYRTLSLYYQILLCEHSDDRAAARD